MEVSHVSLKYLNTSLKYCTFHRSIVRFIEVFARFIEVLHVSLKYLNTSLKYCTFHRSIVRFIEVLHVS